jgi:hypothetical protein
LCMFPHNKQAYNKLPLKRRKGALRREPHVSSAFLEGRGWKAGGSRGRTWFQFERRSATGGVREGRDSDVPNMALGTVRSERNLRRRRRLIDGKVSDQVRQMQKDPSSDKGRSKRALGQPVIAAMAVAGLGIAAMLIVDHGPWNRPQVQTAEVANYKTTGEAAHAVGATVTETAPKASIEPKAPGPKPAQPANPVTP